MKRHNKITFPLAAELYDFEEKWDLHCHSTFGDGKNSVKEMIDAAEQKDIQVFAITEHVRASAMKWWNDYVYMINEHRNNKKIQVLVGMEVNAIGVAGNVDINKKMLIDAELVLGAVHGYYKDDTWEKIQDGTLSPEEALLYEQEKAIGLCNNPAIDVLAHPGWLFEKNYEEMPVPELREIFRAAKITNTAIELNASYLRKPRNFLKILFDENPYVSFGSNAHSIEQIHCVLEGIRKFL